MAYCGPRGIPLSEFLRWHPADQDAALDWMAYEDRRCKNCGTHPADWAEDRLAFHSHAKECPGCRAAQQAAASIGSEERGVFAVMARGPASGCPQCTAD